jgi:GT2 family glycosyltransferase
LISDDNRQVTSLVTVVVVNHNGAGYVERCVAALKRQKFQDFSILVIDNGSKDSSVTGIKARYPDVKLIELTTNNGFAAVNNIAAKQAEGSKWVALVNPDAFAESQWLEKMLAAAQKYSDYAAFGCKMLTAGDPDSIDGTGDIYHVSGAAWRHGHGQLAKDRDMEIKEIFSPCAAAALYRRDVFMEIGGFDDSYFCYFEDVDLGFRLRLAGHRCLYVPDAVVHHVGSATTGERSDFTTYHGQRNLVWTYFKNMPPPLFWLYLPQHLLLNLAMLIWYTSCGQARVIWKAKWDAMKGLPRVLRERREIQATRRVNAWELRKIMAKGWLTPYLGRRT